MALNPYLKGDIGQTTVFATTTDASNTIRLDPEIDKKIRLIARDESPLVSMLEAVKSSAPSKQMDFKWQEQSPLEWTAVTTTTHTATVTTLTVDTTAFVTERTIVYVPRTREQMLVTAVASTTTLTVTRAYGSAGKALVSGDKVFFTSTAAEEGQGKPQVMMRGTTFDTLYCQQIIHATGLTDWEARAAQRGGPEKTRLTEQAIREFKEKRERMALFGVPKTETASGSAGMRTYTSAGLVWFCWEKGWIASCNGVTTYNSLATAIQRIGMHGGGMLYAFGGFDALNKINQLPEVRDNTRIPQGTSDIGFDVNEVFFPGGKRVRFVHNKYLDEPEVSDQVFVTRLTDLRRRVFSPLDIRRGIQDNGAYIDAWSLSIIEGYEHLNTYACGVIADM